MEPVAPVAISAMTSYFPMGFMLVLMQLLYLLSIVTQRRSGGTIPAAQHERAGLELVSQKEPHHVGMIRREPGIEKKLPR